MAGEPFWRISRQDLDKLMTTLDVTLVSLSECTLAAGAHLAVARAATSTIHYCFRGAGFILRDHETPIRLIPHTLVVVPPGRAMTITATEHPIALRNAGKHNNGGFTLGSSQRHTVGDGDPTLVLACGAFRATYGPALDLFASLATPIVERFDVHDQLDQVMTYAMAELAAQEVGGGPMSAALLKLVLLALLRRSLVSTNAWVERFSNLSDPPIARAFAEMASRPSAPHTVQSLSHAVGLSRSAFMARFSAAFEESPMSLLRRVRMRHAADLLAANALSVDQVALNAGYQSRSSFTRTFRRYYGSDPSEYRAKAQRAWSNSATPIEDAIEESDAA
ncbi:AraC family transcriptional regulator [Mesorhizobium sp. B2-4-7]|nr:AraC family transcriptional regulator [Mesorhizobium sp. B3-1-1]TPJ40932.1 AraC family transcriptional regulator [Mesorhizobium sp. B2-6-6]TPJ58954.1 AraC family transcriptional regulator [Mesorhizobium sp. B2-6-1]TPJ63165.1 AraC family transcriptional regulator [Mesorhizobium sp. B2-6-7]TPJ79561.1 AraC family transcriptional regulator [Mesorhizobium sp. B2-6-3]TPJ93758.1 AraC family transcriptional regulator [Mesorhizobium sp. B2-5-12]TPJ94236.1 AraC family transcriptional regulator [Meso